MIAKFKTALLGTAFLLGTPAVYGGVVAFCGNAGPAVTPSGPTSLISQATTSTNGECTGNGPSFTLPLAGQTIPSNWSTLPGSSWVSFGNTSDPSGSGYTSPPTIDYYQDFTLPSNFGVTPGYVFASSLSLMVLADDEVSISLNGGTQIVNTINGTDYDWSSTCPVPGLNPKYTCFTIPTQNESLLNSSARPGQNELEFTVSNLVAGTPIALDYNFQLSLEFVGPPPTPEPATFVLVGAGVLAFGIRRFRARRRQLS
jgi:hypothetical protein